MRMRAAFTGLFLAALVLTGCGEEANQAEEAAGNAQDAAQGAADALQKQIDRARNELEGVDWGEYGDEVRQRLEQLTDDADCQGLQDELAKAEDDDAELTRVIKRQLRDLDCPTG